MSNTSMTSSMARREAVEDAREGLRFHKESIECAVATIQHQRRRCFTTFQGEDQLMENLGAINELILLLNLGTNLEDPYRQEPLEHVHRLHGMAIQQYKTHAQRILEVQAASHALRQQLTGRPLQYDRRTRDERDRALWKSVLYVKWNDTRHDINHLKEWLVSGVGAERVGRDGINHEFERLRERLEEISREWQERLGPLPEEQRGLEPFFNRLHRRWQRREISWEDQCRQRVRRIEQEEESRGRGSRSHQEPIAEHKNSQRPERREEQRPERREERRGPMAKFHRGLEKTRDKLSAGKKVAWAIFDYGIDILAEKVL